MIQTWNNDCTMVKQRWHDDKNVIVRWWKCDGTMMKLQWYYVEKAILFSTSCNRIIVISPSCHCCFIIMPSYFHHCTLALEITIVHICFRKTKILRITVIGRYLKDTISWIVSHLAGISRLASHIVRRRERGNIPLNSIPFIFYIKQFLISF
jgi:hypothetical protein